MSVRSPGWLPVGLALLSLLVLLPLLGCARPRPRLHNVIVVLIDTLRADHLSSYGYSRPTSPNLDAFAGEGLLFENNRSQAPCTFPSVNSLLTSRYPMAFYGEGELYLGIPSEIPSLAEILKAQGYTTMAVSASPIVRHQPSDGNPDGGFGRGFDHFLEDCVWQDAACINDQLEARLDALEAPFFLYVHYFDPHDPYLPPDSYRGNHGEPYAGGREWVESGNPNPLAAMIYGDGPEVEYSRHDIGGLLNRYDDEITYVDAQFAAFLELIEERGWGEDAIFAVLSDHGEAFLEQGDIKHCRSLRDSEIKTPLLLRLPGVAGGRRIPEVAQNLDLVPTILDYLGLDLELQLGQGRGRLRLDGRSLRPLIDRGRPVNPAAFAAMDYVRSAADDRFKLIFEIKDRRFRLYDYQADTGELTDLQGREPKRSRRLQKLLRKWMRNHDPLLDGERLMWESQTVEQRLKALGYLE